MLSGSLGRGLGRETGRSVGRPRGRATPRGSEPAPPASLRLGPDQKRRVRARASGGACFGGHARSPPTADLVLGSAGPCGLSVTPSRYWSENSVLPHRRVGAFGRKKLNDRGSMCFHSDRFYGAAVKSCLRETHRSSRRSPARGAPPRRLRVACERRAGLIYGSLWPEAWALWQQGGPGQGSSCESGEVAARGVRRRPGWAGRGHRSRPRWQVSTWNP